MKILFATSEVVPFAKTGGLADVCGALPIELSRQGHDVSVFMPAFRQVRASGQPIESTNLSIEVPIKNRRVGGAILKSQLPDCDVPVYLIEHNDYFDRPELYREGGEDYADNCERFVFFCRAVLEAAIALDLKPDVIHLHDWQSGLIAAYLKIEYHDHPHFAKTKSVITIHNMAYQGQFPKEAMELTGLDASYFNPEQMEFYDGLNLLKTGLVFADAITTVSPSYSQEIQTAEQGCGLDGVLATRRNVLTGILNGVDYNVWNPKIDAHLAKTYDVDSWQEGKAACKSALREELHLPQVEAPLVAFVGRLADQKGLDLIVPVMERWLSDRDVQWVILGTGEPHYHDLLTQLADQYPGRFAARIEFSNALAHRIEAGADLFLMPSRYEPCGLNQLYSLKYGTPPIVRTTGGLADSVTNCTPESLANQTATGFRFSNYESEALEAAIHRAVNLWADHPADWKNLVHTCMTQDFSWQASAEKYGEVYQQTKRS